MLPGPAVPGCCWISLHFLWGKLSTRTVLFAASMVDQWNEDDRSLPTRWLHLLHSNDPKMWPQTKTLVEWRQWTRFLIKGLFFVDFVFTKCRFFVDFKNILLIFCIYPLLLRSTPFSFIAWKWHNFHAKQSVKMFLFLLHLGAQGSDPRGGKPLERPPENPPENQLDISYTGRMG